MGSNLIIEMQPAQQLAQQNDLTCYWWHAHLQVERLPPLFINWETWVKSDTVWNADSDWMGYSIPRVKRRGPMGRRIFGFRYYRWPSQIRIAPLSHTHTHTRRVIIERHGVGTELRPIGLKTLPSSVRPANLTLCWFTRRATSQKNSADGEMLSVLSFPVQRLSLSLEIYFDSALWVRGLPIVMEARFSFSLFWLVIDCEKSIFGTCSCVLTLGTAGNAAFKYFSPEKCPTHNTHKKGMKR